MGEQDREEETNEGIPRIVLDPHKKVKVNRFEINEEELGEESTREIKNR